MGHSLTAGMQAVTVAGTCAPVVFVEVDALGGNLYVWSGYGNIVWNSQTWVGSGELGTISSINETARVQATGVALTLSGIPTALISLALASLQRYLPAKIWIGAMDDNFAVIADPYLIFNGRVDAASIESSGETSKITVNAESRLIAMRNAKWRRYTDLDQRLERPTDGGFTLVDTIQDATINWHA